MTDYSQQIKDLQDEINKLKNKSNVPRRVISRRNLPPILPFESTLVAIVALDFWNAPHWVWILVSVWFVLFWGGSIYYIFKQQEIDLFEEK